MALTVKYSKERHPVRWVITIAIIGLVCYSAWLGYRWYTTGEVPPIPFLNAGATAGVDEGDISDAERANYTVPSSHPKYLSVPDLFISKSRVFAVKLDSNNVLKTPKNINDTAWYDQSAEPGMGGVILLNGHTNESSKGGVFANLNALKKGADILLERGDGQSFRYTVVDNQSLPIDEVVIKGKKLIELSAKPGVEALNIMTNDGKYVPKLGTYERRTIVRAVLAE